MAPRRNLRGDPVSDNLTIYRELEQGTDEWLQARAGIVTASVVGKLLTPKLDIANNETSRGLIYTLAAERITGRVVTFEPNRAMQRGTLDEPFARAKYAENYAPVEEVGFMVRDFGNFKLGYSPDGLVGDDGLIEIKSREPKIQLQTVLNDKVPAENMAQLMTGLLVTGREWIDYTSYCGGMPLYVKRVYPDPAWFEAITEAVDEANGHILACIHEFQDATKDAPPTEYIDHWAEMEIDF